MAEAFEHTTSAEMEEFLKKNPGEQILRVWVNGRESNGHLFAARTAIAEHGKELQAVRLAFSDHLENHVTPEEVKLIHAAGSIGEIIRTRDEMLRKVGLMWRWYDRGQFLLVLGTIALLIQPTLIAITLWLLNS